MGASPQARLVRRMVGVLATAALLGVAVAILIMILPGSGSPPEQAAAPSATPTATPTAAPQHRGLTPAQRHARAAAVAALRSQGYAPVRLADWNPAHRLRVLIGRPSGDPTGPRRAFFFEGSHYVGTDSTSPSTGLKVSGSGKSWVTLVYGIYSPGDTAAAPSGGHAKVRYEWTGTVVSPVGGTIPAASQRVATTP